MAAPDPTLREYFERMFADLERVIEARFVAHDKALALAERNLEHKHEQMNKFREETLGDREHYARIDTVELKMASFNDRLVKIENAIGQTQGRWALVALGAAVFAGVVSLVLQLLLRVAP